MVVPYPIKKIVLELGFNCNLHCTYCYTKNKSSVPITCKLSPSSILRECLLGFFKDIEDDLKIILIGGESLLYTDEIVKIYKYTKVKRPKLTIVATGRLLKYDTVRDQLDFIHDLTFRLMFDESEKSLDKLPINVIEYLKSKKTELVYVVNDKTCIKTISSNVLKIKETFNKFPKIEYNYLKSEDLKDYWKAIGKQLKSIDYTYSVNSQICGPSGCGSIYITKNGDMTTCTMGMPDTGFCLEQAVQFFTDNCTVKKCKYFSLCNPCISRIIATKGNLCYLTKALNGLGG